MLALRRFALASRSPRPAAGCVYRSYATADTELRGDPGPSTSSFRKQQRSKFRTETLSGNGRAVSRDVLQAVFASDSPAKPKPPRKSWQHRLEEVAQDGRRESGSYRASRRANVGAPGVGEGSRSRIRTWSQDDARQGGLRTGDRNAAKIIPNASWRRAIDSTPGQAKERGLDDPYRTSEELRQFIAKHFSSADSVLRADHRNVNAAIAIVTDKPKGAVSVVVWNQLLHLMGRVGQMDRMWSLYNDMKKYGVAPSAHTFTTLLNAYASVQHSGVAFEPSSSPVHHKTQSRVSIIWQQAQKYLARPPEQQIESGLAMPPAETPAEQEKLDARTEKSRLGPVNAYAKFLARYGQWQALLQLLNDKKDKWDITGYSTVMHGLLHSAKEQKRQAQAGGKKGKEQVQGVIAHIGQAAKQLWDGAHQDLYLNQDKRGAFDANLASACLQGMLMGSPADQRHALSLIPQVFGVAPAPSAPGEAQLSPLKALSGRGKEAPTVKLRLDLPAATALLKTLNVVAPKTAAAHFASAFMMTPRIRQTADEAMIYAAATAYCNVSDVQSIIGLMDGYSQPWGLAGWKMGFWYDALTAARFAPDWEALIAVARRMTIMPEGLEKGKKRTEAFKVGGKTVRDLTGKKWQEDLAHKLDARSMTTILKAALSTSGRERIGEAMRILDWAGASEVLRIEHGEAIHAQSRAEARKQDTKQKEWTRELSKEVIRATENLLEGKDEGEAGKWRALQAKAQAYRDANTCGKESDGDGRSIEGRKRMGTDKLWRR